MLLPSYAADGCINIFNHAVRPMLPSIHYVRTFDGCNPVHPKPLIEPPSRYLTLDGRKPDMPL